MGKIIWGLFFDTIARVIRLLPSYDLINVSHVTVTNFEKRVYIKLKRNIE
jgi:hypothetical protein